MFKLLRTKRMVPFRARTAPEIYLEMFFKKFQINVRSPALCKNLGFTLTMEAKLRVGVAHLVSLNNVFGIHSILCIELVDLTITCLYNGKT